MLCWRRNLLPSNCFPFRCFQSSASADVDLFLSAFLLALRDFMLDFCTIIISNHPVRLPPDTPPLKRRGKFVIPKSPAQLHPTPYALCLLPFYSYNRLSDHHVFRCRYLNVFPIPRNKVYIHTKLFNNSSIVGI